ncbi:isocitrate dehydrogenase 2 [Candidatus Photodesmus katoptron]|uniref:Isocitrate dehydrogenase [NADP] n=1 Tax=Candidatus Photodesmus katoptron Akat1 TaxID=1236703 RepID=S3DL01_9GAMM|nr:NADP-dependent isocitrate dehydrogenase [Candidatus Photodesmus katoptron]EPE37789.1 isocitrate dehydrogenase, NADP-dependent [Candidatus Photodesmus katoptron Akat1]KEY90490.1 isocitrate dehydrogenase 2 [Candidatus Photodesmus katoptron]
MPRQKSTIVYTMTDEAPALSTYSLLPIIKFFTISSGINIEVCDISLASRIIASFSSYLKKEQHITDGLKYLAKLVKTPEANIIKLPNISASLPQIKMAIKELQERGYDLPNYSEEPVNYLEKNIKSTYDRIKGSAVNQLLRDGNSIRFIPLSVKNYARKNPHSIGKWNSNSKTHISSMSSQDFLDNEQSITLNGKTEVTIKLTTTNGSIRVLKELFSLQDQEIIDASVMKKSALVDFFKREMIDAKEKELLFSLHMKASMMKISDPIIFGYAIETYYSSVFKKYGNKFKQLGIKPSNGLADLYAKIDLLPTSEKNEIKSAIEIVHQTQPQLAMVDSKLGITNFHVPSDVIIDASIPGMLRASGKMLGPNHEFKDTKAVIPDSTYSGVYQTVIDFCKKHGAFDPTTMGSIFNIGLMAKKAEEYGSHDTTFVLNTSGTVQVVSNSGFVFLEQDVEEGDIFRMCRVQDTPIRDWVKLAVKQAFSLSIPTVFWLDKNRAHDAQIIKKVELYLLEFDTASLDIRILKPSDACQFSLIRMKEGLDTISVTGNVLRDYLTDLFPILEVGTSAKMLSIIHLMNGGVLFETGSGGCAPKHMQQVKTENHLRWDSLGEFLALASSLEHLSITKSNKNARILSDALNKAITQFLDDDRSPSRKVGELDNRGSHYYLAKYWADKLARQNLDLDLKKKFTPIAKALSQNEESIISELNNVQGMTGDFGGRYLFDATKASILMRPSSLFNAIINM